MPKLNIRVRPDGVMTVEGAGFQGNACEAVIDRLLEGAEILTRGPAPDANEAATVAERPRVAEKAP
jgi:hypothetical protein